MLLQLDEVDDPDKKRALRQNGKLLDALPSKRLLLHAGQAAIMRPITWHAGTANKRAVPRPMLTIIFHKLPADEDEDEGLVGLERGAKEKEGEL